MAFKWGKRLTILATLFALCLSAQCNSADLSGTGNASEDQLSPVDKSYNNEVTQPEIKDNSEIAESLTESSQLKSNSDPSQSDTGPYPSPQTEIVAIQSQTSSDISQSSTIAETSESELGPNATTTPSLPPPQVPVPIRPKRRFNCSRANRTDRLDATTAGVVTLINSTEFAELRIAVAPPPQPAPDDADQTVAAGALTGNQTECAVLLYYLPYCPYSVALAPHYNALARAFPALHFFAVDADRVSPFYANYTTSIAPYIRLFRDRDFLGVNTSLRTLEALTAELANLTGHQPEPDVTVTEADHVGPVSATLVETTDYWLIASCIYFALLFPYLAAKELRTRLALARLRQRLGVAIGVLLGGGRRPHAD